MNFGDQQFRLFVHHRHARIARHLQKHFSTSNPVQTPLNKIAILDGKTFNVYIESLDGLCDAVPKESCGFPIYAHRYAPKKPFVYVKVNHSQVVGEEVESAVKRLNGIFLRGVPVSYYDVASTIHDNREILRNRRAPNESIDFLGKEYASFSYDTSRHNITLDGDTWSVTAEHAHFLGYPGLERRDISVESRQSTVRRMVSKQWITAYLTSPGDYIERVLKSRACFQPNGIGPRASIIECMSLGVPSLIEKNSYVHSSITDIMPVYDPNVPSDPRTFVYPSSEECIYLYETVFAPDAIARNLAARIKEVV